MGFAIRDILQKENERGKDKVVVFKEGTFWKAYNQSAYVLVKRYNFKPAKRYVKAVQQELVSVGFPTTQLQKYLSNAVVTEDGNIAHALVQDPCDERAYQDWKNGLPLKEKKLTAPPVLKVPLPDELRFDPYVDLPKNFYLG